MFTMRSSRVPYVFLLFLFLVDTMEIYGSVSNMEHLLDAYSGSCDIMILCMLHTHYKNVGQFSNYAVFHGWGHILWIAIILVFVTCVFAASTLYNE